MAQEPENNQEPVEGATQEPEAPLPKSQIEEASMVQQLVGGDEPTLQEEIEEEAKGLVGAGMEALEQASPEALEVYEEKVGELPQMVAREEGDVRTIEEQLDKISSEGKYKAQAGISYNPTPTPHGYLERLMKNKDYSNRLFDELGNARSAAGILKEIVSDNQMMAFQNGQDFDTEKAHTNLMGKLFIDLAHRLGQDYSHLDLNNPDFREYLNTGEAMRILESGLAMARDGKRGRFKRMQGESQTDIYERMASRGIFDASGSPSEYYSGISEEEWNQMSWLGKTVNWFPNMLAETGHRLAKVGFPAFGVSKAPRFTPTSGKVVGAITPHVMAILGALRVGNAMGAGRAAQFMIAELAGAAADYTFTIENEGNLSNLLDEHGMLPQALQWMKLKEDDPEAAYKNMIEGGLAGGALAAMLMTLKFGKEVAVGVMRKFDPDTLTDEMMEHLSKMEGGFYKGSAQKMIEMHAGLDLRGMWKTIMNFRQLGEMDASEKATLRGLEENFDKATKDLASEEIDDIKHGASYDELPLDEKYGVDLVGEEWKQLTGSQRFSVLEYKSAAFKDARRWNDSEKFIRDLGRKEKDGTITEAEKISLRFARNRQAVQLNKVKGAHGVDMNNWKQGEETLQEFLERNNVRVDLNEDEIAQVRKARSEMREFGEGVDDVLKNIDDEKVRESVRKKINSREELSEEESEALVEATGLHTQKQIDKLNDEIDALKEGAMSSNDKELFKHSVIFKKWLDGLEDGELKQGILEAVNTGRPLTEVERNALKDAGVVNIYEGLRKKGLIGVDTDEAKSILDQIDDINKDIKETVKEIETKGAKSVEAAEKKLEKRAKKLQDLNDQLDAQDTPATAEQLQAIAKAEEGLDVASAELSTIREMLKDTPHGRLKEAMAKEKRANRSLAKIKQRLIDDKKPLTKEEKAEKELAESMLQESKNEMKSVIEALSKTERGQLRNLLRQLKTNETKLEKKAKQLREEQSKKLTDQELAEKSQLETDILISEQQIKEVNEGLTDTQTKRLNRLRAESKRKQKMLDLRLSKLKDGDKLSKAEQKEFNKLENEISKAESDIKELEKLLSKTAKGRLKKLNARKKLKEKKLKEVAEELEGANKNVKKEDLDSAQEELNRMIELQRELAEKGGRSSGVALGRAQELINKAKRLAEASDEATGELDDLRNAYAQLGESLKEYNSYPAGKVPQEAEIDLERTFYNVQKARVNQEDLIRQRKIEEPDAEDVKDLHVPEKMSQAHKITTSYPVPAKPTTAKETANIEDWHKGNINNGNWRAEDISKLLSEFSESPQASGGWGGKKISELLDDYFNKHQYFRNGSVMRPAFDWKYGLPVWLQNARLLRVSSAVSGSGTSMLALAYGVAATISRRGFQGLSNILKSSTSREFREYSKAVKKVKASEEAIEKADKPSRRNIAQFLFSPSRRRADVTGTRGAEKEGAAFGAEGSELSHLRRSMDANSMTLLGVRAQNIEHDGLRNLMTSIVGIWEVMPREAMGFVDDNIKLATFDKTLRDTVVDVVWRTNREKTDDIGYMADITNAIRQLEEEVRAGKVAHNEVRSWLGQRLGGDFSEEVRVATLARDQAWEMQRELTLQQEVWSKLRFLQKFSQDPVGGHLFMFGKTTANTLTMGLERTPIISRLMPTMRGTSPMAKRDALAKRLVGWSIITSGVAFKQFASEKLIQDKYGNWHLKLEADREEMIEQLEEQFKQQPNLLNDMVENHNVYARWKLARIRANKDADDGTREYNLQVEGDREAYLDYLIGEHKGSKTYTFKRFGHGWSLFAAGIGLNDMITGTANHLPKEKIDGDGEINITEKLSNFFETYIDAYGLADVGQGLDDMMQMIDRPMDAITLIPFIISDSLTPWKGLLQSPGEPLGIALGTRDSRNPDWDAALWWERVLKRNWWGDDGSLPTKRNAVFRPITKGDRLALLTDTETIADPFETEMKSVDIDIRPVDPNRVAGLKNVNTYSWKKDGQTAYDWITSRASEIIIGQDMDITRRIERYFDSNEYQADKKIVQAGLESLKNRGLFSFFDKETQEVRNATAAQTRIRKKILEIRKEYLDLAVSEFKREQAKNFASGSGETLKQALDENDSMDRQEMEDRRKSYKEQREHRSLKKLNNG